jgi:hypothetical protein
MKNKTTQFFLLMLHILISSCSTFYYYPSHQNVLNFKKKGDKLLAGGISPNMILYLNAGYSVTNNVFINSTIEGSSYLDGGFWWGEQGGCRLWKNEVGFYKKNNNFYPSLNIGYVTGRFGIGSYGISRNLNQIYLQPSFGYSNPKHIDVAVSLKVNRNNFSELSTIQSYSNTYFEPAFTFGANILSAKLRYQYSFLPMNNVNALNNLHTFSLHIVLASKRKVKGN